MKRLAILAAATTGASSGVVGEQFNVLDFGARGDGATDDTVAIRAAASALQAAGGGTLLFPRSYIFYTGPFNLSSNSIVSVEGTILGSNNSADYVLIEPLPWFGGGQDFPMSGSPEWHPLIMAWQQSNITITGGGVVDGNGAAWWSCFHAGSKAAPCNGFSRPQLLRPVHVEGFALYNLTLRDSPAWTIHLANVTSAQLHNFTVTAPADQGNTDGVDVDCSSDVYIADFLYAGGDDAIAVKAGEDWLGYTYGRPTSNVLIERMTILSGNGFAVGSEMSAGVHNVTFRDITVNCTAAAGGSKCKHGLYIKTARGRGGVVSGVTVDRSTVSGVSFGHGFTLNYVRPVPSPTNATATPHIEGVVISNSAIVQADAAFSFEGLPESVITGVQLVNLTVTPGIGDSECQYVEGTCADVSPSQACPKCFV